ncbi:OmpA family protein [Vibrio campbellii]|uniref:OmpA family protein n=1 Tax=Vibrio campbellii TaxID=680 RepID=UPI00215D3803|nr:OmpA family protein [Vibrio campbellii]MCR9910983.1 OmpA family protein [Vibrio campbellii]
MLINNTSRSRVMFLVCAVVATTSYPSYAGDVGLNMYIGTSIGYQFADDDNYNRADPSGATIGTMFGVGVNDAWKWDVGYYSAQELTTKDGNITVDPAWWESAFRYDWRIDNRYSIYSRVGAAYWDINKKIKHIAPENLDASGLSPLFEIGIRYALTPKLTLDGGLKYIDQIGSHLTGQYDSTVINFGLNYEIFDKQKTQPIAAEVDKVSVSTSVIETAPVLHLETHSQSKYIVPFGFASSVLDSGNLQLEEALYLLSQYKTSQAVITGHTDSIGTKEANYRLSLQRAGEVKKYLISKGIQGSRIKVVAMGEDAPVANNNTAKGRKANIRAEILIPEFTFEAE